MKRSKTSKRSDFDLGKQCWLLGLAGQQVHTMGQLIKFHQEGAAFDENMLTGIGEILERLGRQVSRITRRIEENAITSNDLR